MNDEELAGRPADQVDPVGVESSSNSVYTLWELTERHQFLGAAVP